MTTSSAITLNWIVGGFVVLILYSLLLRFIGLFREKSTKRLLTSVAFGNGILLAIGLSPLGIFATEVATVSPLISFEFSEFVYSMIDIGTVLDLGFGGLIMYDRGGFTGSGSFYFAFISGFLFLSFPVIGSLLYIFSLALNEFS